MLHKRILFTFIPFIKSLKTNFTYTQIDSKSGTPGAGSHMSLSVWGWEGTLLQLCVFCSAEMYRDVNDGENKSSGRAVPYIYLVQVCGGQLPSLCSDCTHQTGNERAAATALL